MDINNFNLVHNKQDNKRPFYLKSRNSLVCRFNKKYKYYLECYLYDEKLDDNKYYILLSEEKFNENCFKTNIDDFGRYKIRLHGIMKDYIEKENVERSNYEVAYEYTDCSYGIYYDVYSVV